MSEQEFEVSFDLEGNQGAIGSSGKSWDRKQIEQDETVHFKVLPPYGTNHRNLLFHKYEIHWGFVTAEGGKRPVSCSYPTERFCPVCEIVKSAQNERDSYFKKDPAGGKPIQIGGTKERIEELDDTIFQFKAKVYFAVNAYLSDGRVVILELKKTAVENLMGKIEIAIKKKKFDPTSLRTGAWFEITRTGKKLMTKYPVEFKKISKVVDGEELEKIDRTSMPEELAVQIEAQLQGAEGPLYDIHTLQKPTTSAQLQRYLEGEPLPSSSKAAETAKAELAETPEEEGEVPAVSYSTSVDTEAEAPAPVVKAAAAKATTIPKETLPKAPMVTKLTVPAAPKAAAPTATVPKATLPKTPAASNAAAEIARLRAMAANRQKTE
jgi:hypothetical protein